MAWGKGMRKTGKAKGDVTRVLSGEGGRERRGRRDLRKRVGEYREGEGM